MQWHGSSPWYGVVETRLCAVEKTPGTSAGGRERPQKLFGRLKAEKVGSLPPDLVFFPRRLFRPPFRISDSEKKLFAPQAEERAEEEAEECVSYPLQAFSFVFSAATVKGQISSVANRTVTGRVVPPKCWRISLSGSRPAFQAR